MNEWHEAGIGQSYGQMPVLVSIKMCKLMMCPGAKSAFDWVLKPFRCVFF